MFDEEAMELTREDRAAVLAFVHRAGVEWHVAAQLLEATGDAKRALRYEWSGLEPPELIETVVGTKPRQDPDADVQQYVEMIAALERDGVGLVTVLDDAYPTNLRLIYNRPPFLFVHGELRPDDQRSIAVVGTRKASARGLDLAGRLARDLVSAGVTVLSGLALGIDGAAHAATLEAAGRTVAVLGTGIRRIYPRQHDDLAKRIVASRGALVSQFWPDAPPTRWSFPLRNVTMSGMAVGTVVVEASDTSGARNQARRALEHGKRLFLVESLVMQETWAQRYAERPSTTVVQSVDDVLRALEAELRPVSQLTLA
ncbi:MAG TPA: DNA-processing protein DprA [Gaiellaceae bacterium]|nr:DNA-processing protein DprA [Gaiellaceae bacterium]